METEKKEFNQGSEINRFDNRSGRIWGGLVLVIFGGLFLAHEAGVDFPRWIFSWEMIVISIGIYIGARQGFRPGGWMIALAVGSIFLIDDLNYDINLRPYLWPSIIIAVGLYMIFQPKHRKNRNRFGDSALTSSEDRIDATSIFGATKKNIISKNFKGGDITAIFGGTDLNLMQADFTGTIVVDITQIFAGSKLLIPANWNIKSEVVTIFGGIEDKRPMATEAPDSSKVLVLKGTCIFGGIDIKSY